MEWLSLDAAFSDGRPRFLLVGAFYDHATHVLDTELFDDLTLPQYACARIDVDAQPALAARVQSGLPRIVIVDRDGKLLADQLRPTRADLMAPKITPLTMVSEFASLADWERVCDFRLGGFGRPPKQPHAPALSLLLDHPELPWAHPFVERTLNAIVQGGLHDHLGGGFHRAAADDAWVVPQFGKRAADQAALIPLLIRAADLFDKPHLADAAHRAALWAHETLAAPGGGYYNAEDADVGPWDDASFHTWTLGEARAVLSDEEWRAAQPWFDLYGRGELHSDPTRNVIFIATSLDRLAKEIGRAERDLPAVLQSARDKLAAARRERPCPPVDKNIYASSAARLAQALLRFPETRDHALATIDALSCTRDWLEDHAALGVAALAADRHDIAERCEREIDRFRDGDVYRDTRQPTPLGPPQIPFLDGAGESASALCARLLHGLGFTDRAQRLVEATRPLAMRAGPTAAGLLAHWT
jgi:uncharacterized protein YyaL (SSP411 family)